MIVLLLNVVNSLSIWMFPKNSGTPKSSISIRFSIINHAFWGASIFGNSHVRDSVFQIAAAKVLIYIRCNEAFRQFRCTCFGKAQADGWNDLLISGEWLAGMAGTF